MQYRVALHDRVRERLDLKEATQKKVQKRWKTAGSSVIELLRSTRNDPLNYSRAESISSEISHASLYNSPKRGFEHIVNTLVEQEDMVGNGLVKGIELEFTNLSLTLKSSGKRILDNVTGKLSPGRVTAVMGPSGAGKTTFLTALAGKKSNQTSLSGKVLVNGKEDNIRAYKRIIGFVPQDDIVHGNLTVEENLWFSARYRLPSKMTEKQKASIVERTLRSLGLSAIRHAEVGSVERRGISGGQRKRVNVGVEMVMEPSLLILDEPTSGLDSTSSRLVIQALRREAKRNVNVGVVLHQPSYTIFRMFHDVMFLAKGGRVVYHGPVEAVEEYFANLGFSIPERINPPDHIM
ncbi:hypothetical protein CBR_g51769 [Chara braunii]|uniref:ABC transporter domain-containing protein n=1 Tax=Chara braunii TaxID=69332 RepID=A0A388M910_CHABU|nr:hypothetical protein CBR_g51769 [Chara braunii]|eukprot:GBG91036.1 hypothetical protein CBR_g51769 [Chara braunii]